MTMNDDEFKIFQPAGRDLEAAREGRSGSRLLYRLIITAITVIVIIIIVIAIIIINLDDDDANATFHGTQYIDISPSTRMIFL